MHSPKSQRFGPVVATRYRDGTCAVACNRSDCRSCNRSDCRPYAEPRGWRRAVRLAREHAAAHAAIDARYVNTPWGTPAHELPRVSRKPRRRLAAIAYVLLLAVLAFGGAVISVATRADSTPAPTSTTTAPAPYEYIPVPAGPPSSSSAGGDR